MLNAFLIMMFCLDSVVFVFSSFQLIVLRTERAETNRTDYVSLPHDEDSCAPPSHDEDSGPPPPTPPTASKKRPAPTMEEEPVCDATAGSAVPCPAKISAPERRRCLLSDKDY